MSDTVVLALEEQLTCYRRLAKLAELQHMHVQRDQTESLLEVLKSRQTVLDDISRLEAVIAPVKRTWGEYALKIEPDQRARAESLFAEARALLEQITASDQNDALVLQQRKLSVGKQITSASAARKVNRTYAAAAYGPRASRMDLQR